MTWTSFLTSWIPSTKVRNAAAFPRLFSATSSTFANHLRVPVLANTGTEASAARVNTLTGEGTNVNDRIRSKVLQELVVARGSNGDGLEA